MKTNNKFWLALGISMLAVVFQLSAQVFGPATICPESLYINFGWIGTVASNCDFDTWSTNNPAASASGTTYTAAVSSADFGPGSFVLSHVVVCTTGSGTIEDPYVIAPSVETKSVFVNAVGTLSLSSGVSPIPCSASAQTFAVTATCPNANHYTWNVSGGGSIASPTNGNVLSINKPATCSGSIVVTCNARRSDCAGYSGKSTTLTIPVSAHLPGSISGTDALCGGGSSPFAVTAGPNSCWSYNWFFSPAAAGMTISNPSIPNPTISCAVGTAEGNKTIKCSITACGQTVTLSKTIKVCAAIAPPSDITATRQGTTCYWKFTATAGCVNTYDWQVNGGTIFTSTSNVRTPFEPGTYTVKCRVSNGCGTSAWRTETFNLGSFPPPCLWKTTPGTENPEEVAGALVPDLNFTIAPNPSNGVHDLLVTCSADLKGGQIEVYSISGALRIRKEVDESQLHLSTDQLEHGLYFCRISHGKELVVRKFVISE